MDKLDMGSAGARDFFDKSAGRGRTRVNCGAKVCQRDGNVLGRAQLLHGRP
jgi:hypothetical protein